jgi:hypothetical protein
MKKLTVGIAIIASLVCVGNAKQDFYKDFNDTNLKLPVEVSKNKYELSWNYNEKENLYVSGFLLDYRSYNVNINEIIELEEKRAIKIICDSDIIKQVRSKHEVKYMYIFNNSPIIIKSFIVESKNCK